MNKFQIVFLNALLALALCAPVTAQEGAKPDVSRVLKVETEGIRLEMQFEPKHSVEITTERAVRNSDWFTRGFGVFGDDTITTYGATKLVFKTDQRTAMTLEVESATITLPKWQPIDSFAKKVDEGRGATLFTGAVRITVPPSKK